MAYTEIKIKKDNLAETVIETHAPSPLGDGQVRVRIEQLALSANNISYASAGDFLGYWAHFSKEAQWGIVPVWGFAVVTESKVSDIQKGERIFGFFPMASEAVLTPTGIKASHFADSTGPRAGMHPWYTRYYRCNKDPAYLTQGSEAQPILWALFMTGWMTAEQLEGTVDCVYISSASSKTALSLAWALKFCGSGIKSVGITSNSNREFVEKLSVYSETITYDSVNIAADVGKAAYVDIAGNAQVTSDLHVALEGHLVDSVLIGGTHRAPSAEPLPMPGPAPRFFFIPDVAEEKAHVMGFDSCHHSFAKQWLTFAQWSTTWLTFNSETGAQAVEKGYHACLKGGLPANEAMIFTWE